MSLTLSSPITEISGIGDQVALKYRYLSIASVEDLINDYPRRYEDYSVVTSINDLKPGPISLKVNINNVKGRYTRNRLHITEAIASDETGSVRIIWFNQAYRARSIRPDKLYFLSGIFELTRRQFSIINPTIELVSDMPANTARILPVYRESKDINSKQIRKDINKLRAVISSLPENLPSWIIKENSLLGKAKALEYLHFPNNNQELELSKFRLGFEEVFQLSLASYLNKQENKSEKSIVIKFSEGLAKEFVKNLPFKLTDGQRVAIWQAYLDMQSSEPMNRLVEGDVGSGKTVVAAMVAIMALAAKYQVAFMAPTELLARQHAKTITELLKPLGQDKQVVLLIGSMTKKQKEVAAKAIEEGRAEFIIGTHTLIQDNINMKKLGLIIIDEQHRFGVDQRKALMAKAGHMPHVLSLSATPIPRSLALTLYGELDISLLNEKPSERKQIITKIVKPEERERSIASIKDILSEGRQMFVVCPSISETIDNSMKSVETIYEEYSKKTFKEYKVGLLHGKLKPSEKEEVMNKFIKKQLDILVATTVVEVGVDIANASVMLIQSPERFGLAQLHQLRGRVGRSSHQGYCYLFIDDNYKVTNRLKALTTSNDGFKLSEIDLELRGPGAIYGTFQHGALDLRIAKLSDKKLIYAATHSAKEFVKRNEKLDNFKELKDNVTKLRSVTNLN